MPLLKYTVGSRTATRAVEEFRDDFRDALVLAEPELWAADLGLVMVGDFKGQVTFPLPLDAAGYHEFKGEAKFRKLYDRAFSMITKRWQDGVEADSSNLEKDSWIGWADQPAKMALEWKRQPNIVVAAMLEANPVLEFYRNPDTGVAGSRALFASDHPYNVLLSALGSFSNDHTTTVADIRSGKFFEDAADRYAEVCGPNGQPMGLTLDGGSVLTSLKRNQLFKRALERDTVVNSISNAGVERADANVVAVALEPNPNKGTVTRRMARELTSASDNVFFTFGAGLPGAHPFVVLQGASLEESILDKSSEHHTKTGKVAFSSVGELNSMAALPHVIKRWTITG